MIQLKKSTPKEMLNTYFENVISLGRSTDPFPVDLDEVWPLIYNMKHHAVRDLLKNKRFKEGRHYIVKEEDEFIFTNFGENKSGERKNKKKESRGRKSIKYYLNTYTLENFVLDRVPEVFEVYQKALHLAAQRTEGLVLSAIPTNDLILSKTTDIGVVAEYIGQAYKKSEHGEQFPINLTSVFQLRLPTMDDAIRELRNKFYGYNEHEDFIVKKEGKEIGYYLSINGFIKMMGGASIVVARAYDKAVEQGLIAEVPKFIQIENKVKSIQKAQKGKKTSPYTGTKIEKIREIRDRILDVIKLIDHNEEYEPLNQALAAILEEKKFLDNIQEEE